MLARLDPLSDSEHAELRARPLVVVFLHGLFATDLATVDGFIDRLRARNPLTLASAMRELVTHPPHGVAERQHAFAD